MVLDFYNSPYFSLLCLAAIIGVFLYYYILGKVALRNPNHPTNINKRFEHILHIKLSPQGFSHNRFDHPRERVNTYERGKDKVVLYYEPPFDHIRITASSGEKTKFRTTLDQLPEEIRKKTVNLNEAEDFLVEKIRFLFYHYGWKGKGG